MYIVYRSTADGTRYVSAALSKRNGKTSIVYHYLGRGIDEKSNIYQSEERCVFTFDPKSGTFGAFDPSYVPPERAPLQSTRRVSVDFGDAWLVNWFLEKSGFMEVLESTGYRNTDTLRAMPCCSSTCSHPLPELIRAAGIRGALSAYSFRMQGWQAAAHLIS